MVIEAVKSALPLRAYLAEHGFEFVRGKARCLFHDERTPSGSLYRGKDGFERFKCFGCGKDVDLIGAAQELHGLDFKGALKLLAGRAGISTRQTPAERKAMDKARREREKKKALVVAFRQWEQGQVDYLSAMLRAFRSMKARATTEVELITLAEAQAEFDLLEYHYDILCRKDDEAKYRLFMEDMGYAG